MSGMNAPAPLARLVADRDRRNHAAWCSLAGFIAAVLLGLGLPYLVGGTNVLPLPSLYAAILDYVPGGMHTYGALMTALGMGLVEALAQPLHKRAGTRADVSRFQMLVILRAVTGFAAGIVVMFAASWQLSGSPTWQAIVIWAFIGAVGWVTSLHFTSDGGFDGVA